MVFDFHIRRVGRGKFDWEFWDKLKKRNSYKTSGTSPSPLDAQNGAIDGGRNILLEKIFGPWTHRDEREEYGRDERKSAAADGPMITRRGERTVADD